MATARQYEAFKKYLQSLNLPQKEYEKRLQAWCKKAGY